MFVDWRISKSINYTDLVLSFVFLKVNSNHPFFAKIRAQQCRTRMSMKKDVPGVGKSWKKNHNIWKT